MNIINITINSKEDFFLKYNNSKISQELLYYLIDSSNAENFDTKVVINTSLDIDFKKYIIDGLNDELAKNIESKKQNNLFQILLIFLGIFFLCLAFIFQDFIIWHEILLIGGWVPIWEAVDIELFRDSNARKRRYIIKKLLSSPIVIKKETN